ncbi:hypothetical protein TNCT_236801 [Trichonephila clavata]|uniref:Uncharacterized protein n=1 Tax=Trichonephila clavata TaxID=2740835 RepID=A0A8X6IEJ8_TRICU|nr:hypothetical protein TNCT_271261 [Trichonephila clavata]GFR34004.1 hypothetical protein TNCT_236801 [Trichonephila clavata]
MDDEALAFAKDLMQYCFKEFLVADLDLGTIESRDLPPSPFTSTMGRAVILYSRQIYKYLCFSAAIYMEHIRRDANEFGQFAQIIADALIEDNPFLELTALCSFIVNMCLLMHRTGDETLALKGCYAIATVYPKLKTSFYFEGGWENYHIFCSVHIFSLKTQGIVELEYYKI